jgi:hypothetical protein
MTNGFFDEKFEINEIKMINPRHMNIKITKEIKDIIFKYVMEFKISSLNSKLEETKNAFASIENLVGKSVVRDSKIDNIFK